MNHVITLVGFAVNPSGTVQVDTTWNGIPATITYGSVEAFQSNNADLFVAPDETIRWLMYYVLALGYTPETMAGAVGKSLTIDIGPAVQQTISFS